jgi:hypothetical protein
MKNYTREYLTVLSEALEYHKASVDELIKDTEAGTDNPSRAKSVFKTNIKLLQARLHDLLRDTRHLTYTDFKEKHIHRL